MRFQPFMLPKWQKVFCSALERRNFPEAKTQISQTVGKARNDIHYFARLRDKYGTEQDSIKKLKRVSRDLRINIKIMQKEGRNDSLAVCYETETSFPSTMFLLAPYFNEMNDFLLTNMFLLIRVRNRLGPASRRAPVKIFSVFFPNPVF